MSDKKNSVERWRIDVKEYAGDCYTEVRLSRRAAPGDNTRMRKQFGAALCTLAQTCGWTRLADGYVCEGVTIRHPGLQAFLREMAAAGAEVTVSHVNVA